MRGGVGPIDPLGRGVPRPVARTIPRAAMESDGVGSRDLQPALTVR